MEIGAWSSMQNLAKKFVSLHYLYVCIYFGTIHLRCQHVLGGRGVPHGLMVKRSQYIGIKKPLHKHFAVMPMVGAKLYIPSTYSKHCPFTMAHTIDWVCSLMLNYWLKSRVISFTFQTYALPHTLNCTCVSLFTFWYEFELFKFTDYGRPERK